MSTRYFNGTRDGNPYQAIVVARDIYSPMVFEIDVVIFSRSTGEAHDSFSRSVPANGRGQRAAVRAVIANPDNY